MAKVRTNAGVFELEAWTDAAPLWVALKVEGKTLHAPDGGGLHLTVDDLHDLRFCIDRLLGKLQQAH